jgi:hypothetical protein
VSDEF